MVWCTGVRGPEPEPYQYPGPPEIPRAVYFFQQHVHLLGHQFHSLHGGEEATSGALHNLLTSYGHAFGCVLRCGEFLARMVVWRP